MTRKNAECYILWLYGQDSERYAYLNTSDGHKLCKVNKPHHSFGTKLFD